ncbi:MAG: FAD-binding protein, partial [Gammaproteobacteria bacterium]|nr:FAD-binding protein [Gammaproteobacteria bacterium]
MGKRFDIIVAGAGMVGACCALAMARHGYRVAIIEPSEMPVNELNGDGDYDLRVSAVSPASQRLLSELGVWQALNSNRVCEYEKMFVWHEHGQASLEFDSAEMAQASLGAIAENRQIVHALRLACERQANIEWFSPDHIVELMENSEQTVSVQLSSHGELTSDLLIAADGRGSATRELAGLHSTGGDYRQRAIVANIDTELPHLRTAWQ